MCAGAAASCYIPHPPLTRVPPLAAQSIDIDSLDPAHAPGTGTPEIAGMSSREMVALLRALQGLQFVGADIVEVSPAYDHAEITSLAAATIAFEQCCLLLKSPRVTERDVPVVPAPAAAPAAA